MQRRNTLNTGKKELNIMLTLQHWTSGWHAEGDGNNFFTAGSELLKASDETCCRILLEVKLSGRSVCASRLAIPGSVHSMCVSFSWNVQGGPPDVLMLLMSAINLCSQQKWPNRRQPETMRSQSQTAPFIQLAFWQTESDAKVWAIGKDWFKGQPLQARLRQA